MQFNAPENGGGSDYQQIPPGTYMGVCYRMIDIGTQEDNWKGAVQRKRQVVIGWELDKAMDDGRPFTASAWLTQSLNEKATFRKFLASWRGRDFTDEELKAFDPKSILGKPCMITIVANSNNKAKVTGVSKLPQGWKPKELVNPITFFDLDAKPFDQDAFNGLGNGLQQKIQQSPEYQIAIGKAPEPQQEAPQQGAPAVGFKEPEDIPF